MSTEDDNSKRENPANSLPSYDDATETPPPEPKKSKWRGRLAGALTATAAIAGTALLVTPAAPLGAVIVGTTLLGAASGMSLSRFLTKKQTSQEEETLKTKERKSSYFGRAKNRIEKMRRSLGKNPIRTAIICGLSTAALAGAAVATGGAALAIAAGVVVSTYVAADIGELWAKRHEKRKEQRLEKAKGDKKEQQKIRTRSKWKSRLIGLGTLATAALGVTCLVVPGLQPVGIAMCTFAAGAKIAQVVSKKPLSPEEEARRKVLPKPKGFINKMKHNVKNVRRKMGKRPFLTAVVGGVLAVGAVAATVATAGIAPLVAGAVAGTALAVATGLDAVANASTIGEYTWTKKLEDNQERANAKEKSISKEKAKTIDSQPAQQQQHTQKQQPTEEQPQFKELNKTSKRLKDQRNRLVEAFVRFKNRIKAKLGSSAPQAKGRVEGGGVS